MLGKLIKYDLKDILKNIVILYVVGLMLFIITLLFNLIFNNSSFEVAFPNLTHIIYQTLTTFFFLIIVAILILTFYRCMRRFYLNVLGKEGYLTNTIPVKKITIIVSKLIASSIAQIISSLVCLLLIAFVFVTNGTNVGEVFGLVKDMAKHFNESVGLQLNYFLILLLLLYISYTLSVMSLIYLAFSFGQLSNRNRVVFSVFYGILIYIILQFVTLLLFMLIYKINPFGIGTFFSNLGSGGSIANVANYTILSLVLGIVYNLVITIIYTLIAARLLEKKLNLE